MQFLCKPCTKFYQGVPRRGKKYHWSKGIQQGRTWERYGEHVITDVYKNAIKFFETKTNVKTCLEQAKEKSHYDFKNRNVEECLRTLNVIRNLYSTVKEH